ncbi:uncharacterized protein LOC144302276 isoform X2 [Canis aureus]
MSKGKMLGDLKDREKAKCFFPGERAETPPKRSSSPRGAVPASAAPRLGGRRPVCRGRLGEEESCEDQAADGRLWDFKDRQEPRKSS